MPANEFEKQVQNRLDDFQLTPSAFVWKNVEAQIRKKRKRRIIFFIILPLALGLLGYSIYHYVNNGQESEYASQAVPSGSPEQAPEKKEPGQQTTGANTSDKNSNNSEPAETNNVSTIRENEATTSTQKNNPAVATTNATVKVDKTGTKRKPAGEERTPKSRNENDEPGIAEDRRQNKDQRTQNPSLITRQKDGDVKEGNSSVLNNEVKTKNVADSRNEEPANRVDVKGQTNNEPIKSVDQKKDAPVESKENITPKVDSAKAAADPSKSIVENVPAKKKSSRSRFKWGFDISAGLSSTEKRAFSLLKTYAADANTVNSPSAAASPFPGAARTLPPSAVKAGLGLKASVVGELQISKRSAVSIGLQYMYASNKIRTGTADRVLRNQNSNNYATVADPVYRGPQNNSYTNNFHFAALPLAYHLQLNQSEKLGIRWNVGVTPAYLVNTNALIYSTSNGGSYYRDETAFNKFHFTIGTGLSARLQNKRGMDFIIGPEVSFDTRKFTSDASQPQQYMMYGGLGARILFPVKKK